VYLSVTMSHESCLGGDIPFDMKQNRRMFLRNTALAGGAIALRSFTSRGQAPTGFGFPAVSPEHGSAGSTSVRQQFQSPPKKYRPLVRWWWPGNDVTESELRREIDVLDKAGFGGAEIQAFVPPRWHRGGGSSETRHVHRLYVRLRLALRRWGRHYVGTRFD
jgi:hypothetical protein